MPALPLAKLIPLGLTLALGWWLVIRMQQPHWSASAQAELGSLIPWFCAVLLYLRWADRPPVQPPSRLVTILCVFSALGSALGLALLQPIFEANSDWRPPAQAAALCGVTGTFALATLIGGPKWLRHFGVPIALFLAAAPWPWRFEKVFIQQNLMGFNATLCVEILQWIGFEATKQGALISLPVGVLEVEEACSGIRSLQASVALALVAGEACRSPVTIRIAFVCVAVLVALIGNAIRILILAVLASTRGMSAIDHLHDPAGYAILAASLTTVIIMGAWSLRRHPIPAPPPPSVRPPARFPQSRLFSGGLIAVAGLWLASLIGTEAWYRSNESPSPDLSNAWTF
ncbi:MAG: exosortase/archaeosortase family protein, partial [Chthoniobacterales bacterium]